MTVPDWVPDAIFYQIFPDRFSNGDPENDPVNVQAWGSPPNRWDYQGGDLRGIINKFEYLLDLGINAIYLNPIFHSTANHRYHTIDYLKIDPFLGDLSDFKELLTLAHSNNVRVILDSVLNHCGRGFHAFSDVLENGERSPYRDWFHISKFPLNAYSKGKARNYEAWWGIKDLPKFNTSNPEVRNYLFSASRYWLEMGIDGWRLDVPNEIDDDKFWREYRSLVREVNPDAYLLGEIWDIDPRWANEDHFDGLMNYPLRDSILDVLLGKLPFEKLPQLQHKIEEAYAEDNQLAMYNLLGSHDTRRVMSLLDEDLRKVKLAFATIFAYPGPTSIYYGDEIGMRGNKEPESRGAFIWDESLWNVELRDWIKQLISHRKKSDLLRRGRFKSLFEDSEQKLFAFSRYTDDAKIIIIANYSDQYEKLNGRQIDTLSSSSNNFIDLLSGENMKLSELSFSSYQCRWLLPS